MSERVTVTEQVTVASQPGEAELRRLRGEGYRTVINLRHAGEDRMPLSPDQEGEVVSRSGLSYVQVPVSVPEVDGELIERFRQQLAGAPKPALVHCKLGQRAGVLVMIDQARREGLTGEQALQRARSLGMEIESLELAELIRACCESQ